LYQPGHKHLNFCTSKASKLSPRHADVCEAVLYQKGRVWGTGKEAAKKKNS
jgi:hypothetical protein